MLLQLVLALGYGLPSLLSGITTHSQYSLGAGSFFLFSIYPPLSLAISANKRAINATNSTTFVWEIQDTYAGDTFFDEWDFFTGPDPTNGMVNYTTRDFAFANGLAYVENGIAIMKGDNTTQLGSGVFRNSVRINSQKKYNTGLYVLDLNKAPWGCGVWPAWWSVGPDWPNNGEIDIIEGVHDNEHNQVTWHTGPNCTLTPTANFTGSVVTTNGQPNLYCGFSSDNAGCAITEWSRASYGPTFDAAAGGVFAMKWDDTGMSVWSFYRALVPVDLQQGNPKPDTWGLPNAYLSSENCDPKTNFANHTIVFDLTFCGDWAGNSYSTSGCPGTCSDRLMDPANFVNASWSINSLKVYKRITLAQPTSNTSHASLSAAPAFGLLLSCVLAMLLV